MTEVTDVCRTPGKLQTIASEQVVAPYGVHMHACVNLLSRCIPLRQPSFRLRIALRVLCSASDGCCARVVETLLPSLGGKPGTRSAELREVAQAARASAFFAFHHGAVCTCYVWNRHNLRAFCVGSQGCFVAVTWVPP
jgi:hypothetical protein